MKWLTRVLGPPLVAAFVLLLVWEDLVRLLSIDPYVLPAPSDVLFVLLGLDGTPKSEVLFAATWQTAQAALLGFFIAALVGVCLGTAMASVGFLRRGVYPLANLLQMVPVIALAPLLNIWFGYGVAGVAASAAIVAVFPVIANTVDGLRSVEPKLLELFQVYDASPGERWRKLEMPSALPQIFTGLRIAAGLAVIGAVVGELVSGVLDEPPIGAVIASALRNSDLSMVFAAIGLSAFIGFGLFGFVNIVGRLVLGGWHSSARRTLMDEVILSKRSSKATVFAVVAVCALALLTVLAFTAERTAGTEVLSSPEVVGQGKVKANSMAWADVSIQLNWVPEPEFGGIYAAEEYGFFQKERLRVKIIKGGPGVPSPQLTATGQVEFGIMGADQIVTMRAQGAPLVAVYASFDRFPRGIAAHRDGAPDTLAALWTSGRTVAVEAGLPFVKWLNKKYGHGGVELVPSQGGLGLFKKSPDLAQAVFIFAEPVTLQLDKIPTKLYAVADSGYNPYTVVVATRKAYLDANEGIVRRFVRALRAGWQKYLEDPVLVNRKLTVLNPSMSLEAMNVSAALSDPYVRGESKVLGHMTLNRWQTLTEQLHAVEAIEKVPDARACFQNF